MTGKLKSIKFPLLAFTQVFIPLIIILVFQQFFRMKMEVIVAHLLVIASANALIVALGFIFFSLKPNVQKVSKYVIAALFGVFNVILYYSYLLAFSGEYFNSKIFTFEIALGYLDYMDEFVISYGVSPILVYGILLGIPLLMIIGMIWFAGSIRRDILSLRKFIERHNFDNPPKLIRISITGFLLMIGFFSGVILTKRSEIPQFFYKFNEPVANVYLRNDPFDGRILSNKYEDVGVREQYPKDVDFQQKNVVIIVVDALRSDHLGLFGYQRDTSPFLDSLYTIGELRKIDLSLSVAGESFAGINGILRSRIWAHLGHNNFSLQELLKDQGYKLNFIVTGDHSNFSGLRTFYGKDKDLDFYLDGSMTKKYSDPNDDRILLEGLDNIPDYQNNPSYFHFHMMSVHNLGLRFNQYKKFTPASKTIFESKDYINRYDNGILQTDDFIRKIFKGLSDKGYLQNSIVVITGDHGEYLGENGVFGHGRNVSTPQILTPILIYDPEEVDYKNNHYATSIDIAPTIVDRLGLPIPDSWEGVSLFSEEYNKQLTYHQQNDHYALVHRKGDKRYKFIYDQKTGNQELYELNSDLYETKNIIDSLDRDFVNTLRWYMNEFGLDPKDLY